MKKIDALVAARWIVPVEPEYTVWENHALAMDQGKILEILPQEKAAERYQAKENIDLLHHVLLPGLINTHTHTPMTLLRGLADDLALMDWLENHIWPAEKKWISEVFCYDGARLAIAEMLCSGTTCFNDNYFFLENIGQAVLEAGIRASLGVCVLDFPTPYAHTSAEYLDKAEKLVYQYKSHDLISINIAPHAPYTVSDKTFLEVKNFSEKYKAKIQLHLHETQDEIRQSKIRPVKRLYDLDILSNHTQAVHMTQITEEDIRLIKETSAQIVHCPESNLKLASGFCPVKKLLDAGITIALGTDGAASNNDLDMMGEMKTAAILAKAVAQDPTALNAFEALKMSTLEGAKVMGLDKETGSLLPKKSADMIAIDLSFTNTQPVFNIISQIVYAAQSHQVSDVWIAGKRLLKNRQFVNLDISEILQKAEQWRCKIRSTFSV